MGQSEKQRDITTFNGLITFFESKEDDEDIISTEKLHKHSYLQFQYVDTRFAITELFRLSRRLSKSSASYCIFLRRSSGSRLYGSDSPPHFHKSFQANQAMILAPHETTTNTATKSSKTRKGFTSIRRKPLI